MTISEAIYKRINEVANERGLSLSRLALKGGVTPSVVYDINLKKTTLGVITIKKLCDGVGITLSEFFDREYINEIEFDI